MKIETVRLMNYRCFQDSGEIPLNKFSVLIGRNDGGKTSFLKAIDKALNQDSSFEPDDCWFAVIDSEEKRAETLEIRIRLRDSENEEYHIRGQELLNVTIAPAHEELAAIGNRSQGDFLPVKLDNLFLETGFFKPVFVCCIES